MLSHLLLALSLCFAPPDAVVDRPTTANLRNNILDFKAGRV